MDAINSMVLYYLDPFTELLRAIVRAEGGQDAFVKCIQCSMPAVTTYEEALARGAKTLRSRALAYCGFCDGGSAKMRPMFVMEKHKGLDPWTKEETPFRLAFSYDFIRFVGAKWAPIGVTNDPKGLNRNWAPNVEAIYRKAMTA